MVIPKGEWRATSPTVQGFAYARGTDGQSTRASQQLPVSAATAGSNARFWRLTSFTSRDECLESILDFGKNVLCLRHAPKAPFFGAPHPFLWARPKKWGGKRFVGALAPATFLTPLEGGEKLKAAELTPRPFLPFAFYRCQIFSAYSRIARSAAKMPLSAMFTRLMRANSLLLAAVAYSLSWQAT